MRQTTWSSRGRRLAIGVSVLALTLTTAGAAVGAAPAPDEAALAPARRAADQNIERRVNALLGQMTLDEKLEQVQLLPDFLVTDAEVRKGLGGVLSQTDPATI